MRALIPLSTFSKPLRTGGVVWMCNVIAFGLLFWELDGGGAAQRVHAMPEHSSFAFIQQANPHLAPPG